MDILYEGNLQVGLLPFYLLAAGSTVSEIFSCSLNIFLRRRKTRWMSEFIMISFFHSFFLFYYSFKISFIIYIIIYILYKNTILLLLVFLIYFCTCNRVDICPLL